MFRCNNSHSFSLKDFEICFYNACSTSGVFTFTSEELVDAGLDLLVKTEAITVGPQVWFPTVRVTNSKFKFYVEFMFYQLLPAFLLDSLIKLTKRKPL